MTPPGGVEDVYVWAEAELFGGRLIAAYHQFSAETDGTDYGNELDLSVTWNFAERYGLFVGLAHYDAKSFSSDTNKVWVMLSAGF